MQHSQPTASKKTLLIKAVCLVALIVVAYLPVFNAGYVWDDDSMLTENAVLSEGGLWKTWTGETQSNYWPIVFTSFWVEYQLWELNPAGYHLVNLVLHTLSACLLWRILVQLKIPGAWLAALVFAVHPVNVESVAWITQRKNTLCMIFYLSSLSCYLKSMGSETSNRRAYLLSLVCFLLALLSKGAVVGLPFVLLLISFWQKGSISRKDVYRTIPFFAVAFAMCGVEMWFQSVRVIGPETVRAEGLFGRLVGAGSAAWFYLSKQVVPINLSFVYPYDEISTDGLFASISWVLTFLLFAVCWIFRGTWGKHLLLAVGYFVLLLLPILGLVDFYFMKYSLVGDHYQYFAMPGTLAFVIGTTAWIVQSCHSTAQGFLRRFALASTTVIVASLSVLTWQQSRIYHDTDILYLDTMSKNPRSSVAHTNISVSLIPRGHIESALHHARRAIEITPQSAKAIANLGAVYQAMGEGKRADMLYRDALSIDPSETTALYNLGILAQQNGDNATATDHYRRTIAAAPRHVAAHNNLGNVLCDMGKCEQALFHYTQATLIRPSEALGFRNLAAALHELGRYEEALTQHERAYRRDPLNLQILENFGATLQAMGRHADALGKYQAALNLSPQAASLLFRVGDVLAELGDHEQAVFFWKEALKLDPNFGPARNRLLKLQGKK